MDKAKETINYILYTLEHYPYPQDDLEWSTEQVRVLLAYIKELEVQLQVAEEDSHWWEDWQKLNKHMEKKLNLLVDEEKMIKKLEKELAKIKSDPSIGKLEVQDWPESPDY